MIQKLYIIKRFVLAAGCAGLLTMCYGSGGNGYDAAPDDGQPTEDAHGTDSAPDLPDMPDSGDNAQMPINCSDRGACSHNGTCRSDMNPPTCECFEGRYSGERCEACSGGHGWFEGVCAAEAGRRAAPDRGYEWYRTQMGTGRYEVSNCGPTSVSMSMKWFQESLDVGPGIVREAVTPGLDGWWYTTDVENALDEYGIPYAVEPFGSIEAALAEIDAGYILILCLGMGGITRQDPPYTSRFNRFYDYDTGHFIVVKGYMEGGEWLDVYDSNNWTGDYYTDGSPYGKDRFYSGSEVLSSAVNWWANMFVVGASPTRGLDTSTIPIGRSGP